MFLSSSVNEYHIVPPHPGRAVPSTVLPFWCHLGQHLQKLIFQTALLPTFGQLLSLVCYCSASSLKQFMTPTSSCILLHSAKLILIQTRLSSWTYNVKISLTLPSSSVPVLPLLQHGSAPRTLLPCHALNCAQSEPFLLFPPPLLTY